MLGSWSRRKLLVLVTAVALVTGLPVAVMADDHDATVEATVTVAMVAVAVSEDSVAYGILPLGEEGATPDPGGFHVTNEGNFNADFFIAAGVSSPSSWTPVEEIEGPNQYRHLVQGGAMNGTPLTTEASLLSLNRQPGMDGFIPLELSLDMPLAGSDFDDGAPETLPIIVTAVLSDSD